MIEVENLTKQYGDHLAVDHLSFHIEKGKIYGFLGPNGAGKSTTMNMMTGYIAASEGTVKINGYDILKEPELAKKSIGYLPELPPVYQDMTVGEYLRFASEIKQIAKKDRLNQINRVMEMTGIADVENRLIKNLSKGYKQRVGLAQAIIGDPEVIILDEPTVGLDPKQIIEIRELIKELSKNHTIILSSHILSEVSAVCDHILIISKGKMVASDTPEGLLKKLNGFREIIVTIDGEEEQIKSVLDRMEAVQEYQFMENKEDEYTSVMIRTQKETDIRKELFFMLADEKLAIMELTNADKSLEDVFLELTGGLEDESDI